MDGSSAPPEIVALADERASARSVRDWATADELKARIEAAGWRIVDDGVAYALSPSRPADVVEDGEVCYGVVDSVPSRLEEPDSAPATVVIIADNQAVSPVPVLVALAEHRQDGTQLLLVAERALPADGPADEIIRTVEPFSPGDALQAALRRATGGVIVVLEPDRVPGGDIVAPLMDALGDPSVAVAGIEGLVSADLHRYGPSGLGEATTVGSGCYAFRRAEAIARGPIDGRLRLRGSVAAWLGLLLRDDGPDAQPRRALAIDLPLGIPNDGPALAGDHARRARRDGYRIVDRFGRNDWLASREPGPGRIVGDGTEGNDRDDDAHEADHTGAP